MRITIELFPIAICFLPVPPASRHIKQHFPTFDVNPKFLATERGQQRTSARNPRLFPPGAPIPPHPVA